MILSPGLYAKQLRTAITATGFGVAQVHIVKYVIYLQELLRTCEVLREAYSQVLPFHTSHMFLEAA